MAEMRNFAKLQSSYMDPMSLMKSLKKKQQQTIEKTLILQLTRALPADCSVMFAYPNRVLHASVDTESKIKAYLFFPHIWKVKKFPWELSQVLVISCP